VALPLSFDRSGFDARGGQMTGCRLSGILCGLWVCVLSSTCDAQKLNHNSYLNRSPPEIRSQQQHWLGCNNKAMLADLKGNVVWLQFNF
jgi:hypothetical protein